MQTRRAATTILCGLMCWSFSARPEARSNAAPVAAVSPDAAAMHEMLEGTNGRRETWPSAPALVIETTVLDYGRGDLPAGFTATNESLTDAEVTQLKTDLGQALGELTGGTFKAFRAITVEGAIAGDTVKVLRPGVIVVARYRDVQAKTGNLGYGGRMARNGTITQAAVVLDALFDRQSGNRLLLRTHELGHALGFNHVESRPSVMNPRVGSSITDFDRAAIRQAFPEAAESHLR